MSDTIYVNTIPDLQKDHGSNFNNSVSCLYVCEIKGDEDYGVVFKAVKVGATHVDMRSLKDDSLRTVHVNQIGDDGFTAQVWTADGRLCRSPLPPMS